MNLSNRVTNFLHFNIFLKRNRSYNYKNVLLELENGKIFFSVILDNQLVCSFPGEDDFFHSQNSSVVFNSFVGLRSHRLSLSTLAVYIVILIRSMFIQPC